MDLNKILHSINQSDEYTKEEVLSNQEIIEFLFESKRAPLKLFQLASAEELEILVANCLAYDFSVYPEVIDLLINRGDALGAELLSDLIRFNSVKKVSTQNLISIANDFNTYNPTIKSLISKDMIPSNLELIWNGVLSSRNIKEYCNSVSENPKIFIEKSLVYSAILENPVIMKEVGAEIFLKFIESDQYYSSNCPISLSKKVLFEQIKKRNDLVKRADGLKIFYDSSYYDATLEEVITMSGISISFQCDKNLITSDLRKLPIIYLINPSLADLEMIARDIQATPDLLRKLRNSVNEKNTINSSALLALDPSLYLNYSMRYYLSNVMVDAEVIIRGGKVDRNDNGFRNFLENEVKLVRGGKSILKEFYTNKKEKSVVSRKEYFEKMILLLKRGSGKPEEILVNYSVDNLIEDITSKKTYRDEFFNSYYYINHLNGFSEKDVKKILDIDGLTLMFSYRSEKNKLKLSNDFIIKNKLIERFDSEEVFLLSKKPRELFHELVKNKAIFDFSIREEKDLDELLQKFKITIEDFFPYISEHQRSDYAHRVSRDFFLKNNSVSSLIEKGRYYSVSSDLYLAKDKFGEFILTQNEFDFCVMNDIHRDTTERFNYKEYQARFTESTYELFREYLSGKIPKCVDLSSYSKRNLSGLKKYLMKIGKLDMGAVDEKAKVYEEKDGRIKLSAKDLSRADCIAFLKRNRNVLVVLNTVTFKELDQIKDLKNKVNINKLVATGHTIPSDDSCLYENLTITQLDVSKTRDTSATLNFLGKLSKGQILNIELTGVTNFRNSVDFISKLLKSEKRFKNNSEIINIACKGDKHLLGVLENFLDVGYGKNSYYSSVLFLIEALKIGTGFNLKGVLILDSEDSRKESTCREIKKREFEAYGGKYFTDSDTYEATLVLDKVILKEHSINSFQNVSVSNLSHKAKLILIDLISELDPRYSSLNIKQTNLAEVNFLHNYNYMVEYGLVLEEEDISKKFNLPEKYRKNKAIVKSLLDLLSVNPSILGKFQSLMRIRDRYFKDIELDCLDFFEIGSKGELSVRESMLSITEEDLIEFENLCVFTRNPMVCLFSNIKTKKSLLRAITSSVDMAKDTGEMIAYILNGLDSYGEELEDENEVLMMREQLNNALKTVSSIDDVEGIHDRLINLSSAIKSDPLLKISKDFLLTEKVEKDFLKVCKTIPFFPKTRGDLHAIGPMHGWCVHTATRYQEDVILNGAILVGLIPKGKEKRIENIVALANFTLNKASGKYNLEQIRWSKLVKGGGMESAEDSFPVEEIILYLNKIKEENDISDMRELESA